MAFAGAKGRLCAQIRAAGSVVLSGDRVAELTGISAPVFDAAHGLVGALTLTLPSGRLKPEFESVVRAAARRLSGRLGAVG